MGDYLKGEKVSTTYQQFVVIGGAADRAGIAASQKQVWTDDGADGRNLFPYTASTTALRLTGTYQLQFQDAGTYIKVATSYEPPVLVNL